MNPAITIPQWILGRKSLQQVIVYVPAQVLGAMAGTAVAYWNYIRKLSKRRAMCMENRTKDM